MDWQAVGAIGEILGAIGVIITLGYLAIQVRQNSKQIERSIEATRVHADDAVVENFNNWRHTLASSPDVADVFARGLFEPEGLSQTERLRFNALAGTYGWTAWQLWRVEALLGTPNAHILRHLLLHKGGRMWYIDARPLFPPDFRASVDEVLAEIEEAGAPFLTRTDVSSMFMGRLEIPRAEPGVSESPGPAL